MEPDKSAKTVPLTTSDVAERFGVTPDAVRNWCAHGTIPHFRTPGGHLRFRAHEIDPLVEAKTIPAEASA